MLGLLALHIAAMLFWVASLMYLPILIISHEREQSELLESRNPHESKARFVFTQLASPAALLAIVAGTLVFVVNNLTVTWLIAKLVLVAGLVVGHTLLGVVILRMEAGNHKTIPLESTVLLALFGVLATAIVWLVLAKPSWDVPV